MSNCTAPPAARVLSVALVGLLAALGGCKGEDKPAAATSPADAVSRATFEGITFEHPVGWKVTALVGGRGMNVTAPEDAGWEPNVFLEVQPNPDGKALDELITSNLELLGARKQDFQVRHQMQADHPNGFRYGRVEYTNSSEGSPSVPLTQWSVIVPLPGKPQRLQVQTAAATAAWEKYRPQFEKVVDSIRLPK